MVFKEPKVEFVEIDLGTIATTGSICAPLAYINAIGGGQRCLGTQPEADPCDDWDYQFPWGAVEN